jgi:spore coat protein U-like protein
VVATTTLDFNNLSTTQDNNGSTSVGLSQCGTLTAVDITFDNGDNASVNGARQLSNGTDTITYVLQDSNLAAISGPQEVPINGGNGSFALNGFIGAADVLNKSGGDYLDKLDVTVDFAS